MKVLFVDFDDSFSFNIISQFRDLGFVVENIHWTMFDSNKLDYGLLILGPGPGHPNDYSFIEKLQLFKNNNPKCFLLGICLGHQLLGLLSGLKLKQLEFPIHGRSMPVEVPNWRMFSKSIHHKVIMAQFYNSWVLTDENSLFLTNNKIEKNGYLVGFRTNEYLGLQFHPESVGTTDSNGLFDPTFFTSYNQ